MARLTIAATLARWVPGSEGTRVMNVSSTTLRGALDQLFTEFPMLRPYVLDDQGALRHHLAIFIDGVAVRDKARLEQALSAHSEIFLAQSLSGG
jgi:sulfur-carrier protein